MTTAAEYLARIESRTCTVPTATGCMLWEGATANKGYGAVRYKGRTRGVHRVVYELVYGAIPDGLVIDHICGMAACVNPRHLRAVSVRENSQYRVRQMSNNTSGYPNVWFNRTVRRWQSAAGSRDAREHLGYFDSAWDAYCAWKDWALKTNAAVSPHMMSLRQRDVAPPDRRP